MRGIAQSDLTADIVGHAYIAAQYRGLGHAELVTALAVALGCTINRVVPPAHIDAVLDDAGQVVEDAARMDERVVM